MLRQIFAIALLLSLLGCNSAPTDKPTLLKVDASYCYGPTIAAADFDRDGDIDVFSVDSDGQVFLHVNVNGLFRKEATPLFSIPSLYRYGSGLAACDWDNDGDTDFLVATPDTGDVFLLLNEDGQFKYVDPAYTIN